MPPKKHLDGQGRRRNHCRRAVQLSEFLRGDDEPTVQAPVPPTESQGTTESSIGTIPPTDRSAGCVTVTPVVTPDTTTDEPEKVSLQEETPPSPPPPPPPVNVWQLSSGEKDRPQGTFVPDDKAFPGLGKQGKKFKPLVFPEASRATRSPDSAKARRVCPVLGNFLPESLFPDKNRTVARWLSSVRSAQDTGQPASCSPSPLKRAAESQQAKSPGCSSSEHNLPTRPVMISPHRPASRVAVAAAASVPPLEKGLSQLKQPQKSPKNSNENEQQQQSSKQKMPENAAAAAAAARETKAFEEKDCVAAASQFSAQNLSRNRSFWEESEDSLEELEEEQSVAQQGERETIRHHRFSLNANAQEFRPMAREEEEMEMEPEPEQLPETRIKRRRHSQRYIRAMKRRQCAHLNWNQFFENQKPVQGQEQSQALPSCYYSAPPAAGHQQQQASPVTQNQLNRDKQLYEEGAAPATPTFSGASSAATPVHVPSAAFAASSSQIPSRRQNNVSQFQVFQISCLPSKAPSDIQSLNQLPSSISGASRFTHTLSSLPPVEVEVEEEEPENYPENCPLQRSIISPDLFYNRSLLDMDREDTQQEQEEEEQASPRDDRETETDRHHQPPDAVVVVPSPRKPIFRSPSSHDEGYPPPDLNCVPASIKKLHKTITERYSDYAFVYALSAQLGQECVPMDCYVYLKMILLASIVSIEPDELRPPISLCIISTDSLMANRLMNCIGQLAPRFLGPHEYGLQPTIAGGQLSLSSRYSWVVASPLLLAQQGVYYAGDWTRLSKEQTEQMEKCIENGSVPVPQLQNDQALEAAIWTHWQPENSSNQTLAFAKLCPIFGLPIFMGEAAAGSGSSSSSSDSLWSFLLRQHSEPDGGQPPTDGLNIPEEDVRMLLHLLHQRQLTFEDKAQHMLQKYYVISRKERPNVFTSKTYIVLKQFSESFAKLALRLEVLESDVCLAIFHCEHFVQQIFGGTSPPPPAVNSFAIISHIDPYMNVFGRWLLQYLDRYDDQELGMHKHAKRRRRTVSWEFL